MNHVFHDSRSFYRIFPSRWQFHWSRRTKPHPLPLDRPSFATLARWPVHSLPFSVRSSPIARKYLSLLRPIDWNSFPDRQPNRIWSGPRPASPVPYLIALLIKLDQRHRSLQQLPEFLIAHPELVWLAGFPLVPCSDSIWGFHVAASVPSATQFSRVLRRLPNDRLQFLLDETVWAIQRALPSDFAFGDVVSIDTKHILAWIQENNPKAYIKEGRFDKTRQPKGDPDCRLGCKRRKNQRKKQEFADVTPAKEGKPASSVGIGIGEFYWGYASGVAATKVPGWGEFVLAELTPTFDKSDPSYFFPLMAQVERRLKRRPKNGTADAAYDAFYVYAYFHEAGGMAAVPLTNRGRVRLFDEADKPLCDAGLPMFLKGTFMNRTSLIEHPRQRWWCPLLFPEPTAISCPVEHRTWARGGCKTTIAASVGARLRYQLDRDGEEYKEIYKQRTAVERIFGLALDLGIERPKLRSKAAIANQNTLIYVLLNLRRLQNMPRKQAVPPLAD
jgi:hypothetical protein